MAFDRNRRSMPEGDKPIRLYKPTSLTDASGSTVQNFAPAYGGITLWAVRRDGRGGITDDDDQRIGTYDVSFIIRTVIGERPRADWRVMDERGEQLLVEAVEELSGGSHTRLRCAYAVDAQDVMLGSPAPRAAPAAPPVPISGVAEARTVALRFGGAVAGSTVASAWRLLSAGAALDVVAVAVKAQFVVLTASRPVLRGEGRVGVDYDPTVGGAGLSVEGVGVPPFAQAADNIGVDPVLVSAVLERDDDHFFATVSIEWSEDVRSVANSFHPSANAGVISLISGNFALGSPMAIVDGPIVRADVSNFSLTGDDVVSISGAFTFTDGSGEELGGHTLTNMLPLPEARLTFQYDGAQLEARLENPYMFLAEPLPTPAMFDGGAAITITSAAFNADRSAVNLETAPQIGDLPSRYDETADFDLALPGGRGIFGGQDLLPAANLIAWTRRNMGGTLGSVAGLGRSSDGTLWSQTGDGCFVIATAGDVWSVHPDYPIFAPGPVQRAPFDILGNTFYTWDGDEDVIRSMTLGDDDWSDPADFGVALPEYTITIGGQDITQNADLRDFIVETDTQGDFVGFLAITNQTAVGAGDVLSTATQVRRWRAADGWVDQPLAPLAFDPIPTRLAAGGVPGAGWIGGDDALGDADGVVRRWDAEGSAPIGARPPETSAPVETWPGSEPRGLVISADALSLILLDRFNHLWTGTGGPVERLITLPAPS